jgi:DNA-3-methyladenine glycosylase I
MSKEKNRCSWAGNDPLYVDYHDKEWGRPVHDDRVLFEFLILEGAQAGLSWITVLRKRENYRKAFSDFDPKKIARFDKTKVRSLLQNEGIIRNRLKVESTIRNARSFLEVQKEFGTFDAYLWGFVDGKPKRGKKGASTSDESDRMSRDLKKRNFNFVGTTICYSLMQACGLTNDHAPHCFLYKE